MTWSYLVLCQPCLREEFIVLTEISSNVFLTVDGFCLGRKKNCPRLDLSH